jgi:hypothetical protein
MCVCAGGSGAAHAILSNGDDHDLPGWQLGMSWYAVAVIQAG